MRLAKVEHKCCNLHPPPYATQLDDAPALDKNLRVQAVLGQVQYKAVGSTAVRDIEAERQPLVGLHGHIHESSGIRRLGKRRGVILNPGSDYSTGALNGALVSLQKDRATAHYARLEQAVADTAPGAGGLVFAPVLGDGERDDPALRGVVTGLSLRHDRGAVARAALEGVACGVRSRLNTLGRDLHAGHRAAGVRRGRGHGGLEPDQGGRHRDPGGAGRG